MMVYSPLDDHFMYLALIRLPSLSILIVPKTVFTSLFTYVLCVCICMSCMCQVMQIKVKGSFTEISSSLSYCDS